MCGIFFYLYRKNGQHKFNMNFFEPYLNNPYFTQHHSELLDQILKETQDIQKLFQQSKSFHIFSLEQIDQSLKDRGPDGSKFCSFQYNEVDGLKEISGIVDNEILDEKSIYMTFYHSLLHLRGIQNDPIQQPCFSQQTGNLLLFNGEIYSFQNQELQPNKSDTLLLLEIFNNLSFQNIDDYKSKVLQIFQQLHGDFAIIYLDYRTKNIIIGKDFFGKKSLLLTFTENGVQISSNSIGKVKFDSLEEQGNSDDDELSKNTKDENYVYKKYLNEYLQIKGKTYLEIPSNQLIFIDFNDINELIWTSQTIHQIDSFGLQTYKIPNVLLEEVQLVKELTEILKSCTRILIQNIFQLQDDFNHDQNQQLQLDQQNFQQDQQILQETNSSLAILFSGGLDCSIIAYMAGLQLTRSHSIDLLNVSFQTDSPDRLTAIQSYYELKTLLPLINFNLILIDKTIEDINSSESEMIDLLYPKITHMDFNIAIILKYASLGKGVLYGTQIIVQSKAKVILSGLGADELFCGYSRYRVAYLRGGVQEQFDEITFGICYILRLWIRNLGRDDRSVSSSGKELRFPYLDINLLKFVKERIDFSKLADYTKPKGTGDKEILRALARSIGFKQVSEFKKRAIQFGSRLAKISNLRHFGGNKRAKGTKVYNLNQKNYKQNVEK